MNAFAYTKSWRSQADFPTVETSEVQVREDMQCLFDEAAAGINAIIDAVNAGGMGSDIAVDETLMVSGAAADAAATGEKINTLAGRIGMMLTEAKTYARDYTDQQVGDLSAILDEINGEVV